MSYYLEVSTNNCIFTPKIVSTTINNSIMKNFKGFILGTGVAIAMLSACTTGNEAALTKSNLDPARFDTIINEKPVKLYVLTNENGMECRHLKRL